MYGLSQIASLIVPLLLPGLALIIVLKFKLFKSLDIPIDFGITLNSKRIFGRNKRLKGIIVMTVVAIFVSYILGIVYWNGYSAYIDPIFSSNPLFIGFIYSLSYTLGELVNSFAKRQMNIAPGAIVSSKFANLQTFFDLSDGIIVAIVALITFTSASVPHVLIAGFVGILLHYCTDILMKKLSLKH